MRPFDFRRDQGAVADLVELCFAETLDPDGREYLTRMRSTARSTSLAGLAKGWANAPLNGFVWQENGRIIGNVSLIPYLVQGQRCYLIANVAVHPDYRLRGIGQTLTERAIEFGRSRRAPAVWLHVRLENQIARGIYLAFGFQERAVRTTWVANPDNTLPGEASQIQIAPLKNRDWQAVRGWLQRSYPAELAWHSWFRLSNLRPGVLGVISRFLHNAYVYQWAARQHGRLAACGAWQATYAYANAIWLAAPDKGADEAVLKLLQHIRRRSPTRRALALEYPAGDYAGAIQEAGFREQQTLVWMELKL